MREFQTAEELFSHYDAVKARLRGPQKPKIVSLPPRQPSEEDASQRAPNAILQIFQPPVKVIYPPLVINPTIAMPPPDFVPPPKKRVGWFDIVRLVERHTGISRQEMFGPRRQQYLIKARFLLWGLAFSCAPHLSIAKIGKLSNRDHTTILHGYKKGQQHELYEELRAELMASIEVSEDIADQPAIEMPDERQPNRYWFKNMPKKEGAEAP